MREAKLLFIRRIVLSVVLAVVGVLCWVYMGWLEGIGFIGGALFMFFGVALPGWELDR
jgi:hypothetical protein